MGKSFLNEEQWARANQIFPPIFWTPNGDVRFTSYFGGSQFAAWLGAELEAKLKSFPGFIECEPVMLGSWSRGELCPNSDIDLLFSGDTEKVKDLVDRLHQAGLRIRYRVPADPDDWTVGVQSFDILALWKAKPLSSNSAAKLFAQQKRLWENKTKLRKNILKDLLAEKKMRAGRFNSISNYLEPNLKYGPGGLRDIEQAQQLCELFSEKFQNASHASEVLNYHKAYLITLRQKLHLMGCGEVLVNTAQFDLAGVFNFRSHKDFMRDLERGLSRSQFYVDWIFAKAEATTKKIEQVQSMVVKKPQDLYSALKTDPSPLVQQHVRANLNAVLPPNARTKLAAWSGKVLMDLLSPQTSKEVVQGVFQSRLIDKILPSMKHLVGYVQHDQYHRYTADVHIMQACILAKDIFKNPKLLGPLQSLHQAMKLEDWKILAWGALYHDLAKGLESADHSDLGEEIVRRDFKAYGFSKVFTDEVSFIVKNHLELSIAAFRKNPKARSTWEDLQSKGITGKRLKRLAIFTVIDICATNPEAWSEWKGRLLNELVESLESTGTKNYFSLKESLHQKKLSGIEGLLEDFDVFLIESLPASLLATDLKKARNSETDLVPLVHKKPKELWIRFHSKSDQEGLLANYVQQLYSLGVAIRHAAVQTLPGVGVYDWFQVSTSKAISTLEKLLKHSKDLPKELPLVHYDEVHWISQDDGEWVLGFTGKDQAGFLATATQALAGLNLNIKSARVHTWGQQVNDLFTLRAMPSENSEELLEAIRKAVGFVIEG